MNGTKVAWGGNAWGNNANAPTREPYNGESACCICFNAPEEVRFSPCKHEVCRPCLDRLRQANIFKADAGVKCPFCRQYVEGYNPISEGGGHDDSALLEANRAARAAAVARQPVAIKKQAALQDIQAPPAHLDWECTKCQNINFATRPKCNKCGEAGPNSRAHVPSGTGVRKDVMKCNHKEIMEGALEKMHPNFQAAFEEAGTPALVAGLPSGSVGGDADTVIKAMVERGQERLHRIIRLLSENGHVKELVTAFFGNYTLQELLDATHKLRQAAAKLRALNSASKEDIDRMLGFADGQDALGRLARGIVEAMPEGATHKQGFFVVDKLLAMGEPADMLPLAVKIFPTGPQLTANIYGPDSWRGMNIMVKLVEAMSELALQRGHMSGAAMGLLDSLCGVYLKDEQQLMKLALNRHSGPMLVDAAFAGLPRLKAVQMLDFLARNARQLAEHRSGLNTVTAILALNAIDEKTKDIVVTAVCVIAQALEGSFAKIMGKIWNPPQPAAGADLVWTILQRLDEENEHSWVQSIVKELHAGAYVIRNNKRATEVYMLALNLKGLPDEAKLAHAQKLCSIVGEEKATVVKKILDTLRRRLGNSAAQPSANTIHPGTVRLSGGLQASGQDSSENGLGEDYSSAFASPPRDLPAATAPAAPPPSVLGPHHAQPPQQPQGPMPNDGPPAQAANRAQPPPLTMPPPPRHMANGARPPLMPKLMVSPRQQGYQPGPAPAARLPPSPAPVSAREVPPSLAALLPHLMVGVPPAAGPPASCPPEQPPAAASSSAAPHSSAPHSATNGHARAPHSGPAPTAGAGPSAAPSVAGPGQPLPAHCKARPPQNGHVLRVTTPPAAAPSAARTGTQGAAAKRAPAKSLQVVPPARQNGPSAGPNQGQPTAAGNNWSCQVCTYKHEGAEADFLACAVCGTPMPPT